MTLDKQKVILTGRNSSQPAKGRKLTQAAVWMNLEDITFSEINQSQKGPTLFDTYLYEVLRAGKFIDRMVRARGWGVSVINGDSFRFARRKEVCGLRVAMVAPNEFTS